MGSFVSSTAQAEGAADHVRPSPTVSIGSGFRIVSIATLLSRVLGLARDVAMAALFGAGPLMDSFTVAFRVPNLVRRLLGEGAMTAAFLPVFVREQELSGIAGANRLMTAGTLALGGSLLAIVVVAELVLVLWGLMLSPDSDGHVLIVLTAQMLPYAVLICVAAHFSAVLQSLGRFVWPALIPVILNVIWIAAVVLAPLLFEESIRRIQWVSMSIVAAGVCQLIAVWIAMHKAGVQFTRDWPAAAPQVREVIQAMIPVILATSVSQLNSLFDSLLAWGLAAPSTRAVADGFAWPLEAGTASALYFAQRMYQFPLGVFGAALGTVLLPRLSRHTERGELEQVGRDLTLGVKLTIAIGLPASVGLILLREPIAAALFERGAFTGDDSALTARCIAAYGLGVCPAIGLLIIHRGFFVLGDRRTPVRFALRAIGLNVLCNLTLLWFLAGAGLALATSIAALYQFLVTAAAYQRTTGLLDVPDIGRAALRAGLATAVMAIACGLVHRAMPAAESLPALVATLAVPVAAGTAAYLVVAWLVGLSEPFILLRGRVGDP